MLGIMSVDEPLSGLRPSDDDLAVLAALAAHAAQAVQDALAAAEAARHRTALEQLLRVSARLTQTMSIDAILQEVCAGIRAALGFNNVSVELIDHAAQRAVPRAVVGWTTEEVAASQSGDLETLRRLLDPRVRGRGLLPAPQLRGVRAAGHRAPRLRVGAQRQRPAGLGPPLARSSRCTTARASWSASSGPTSPRTGSCPSTDRLQALRMFANQAATAVAAVAAFEEMQFLAENDPLTRRGQPPRLHPPPGRGGPPRRALRPALRARRPRRRRLQGAQRPLRPLRGRPGARGDRRGAARHPAPLGQRLPPGRRRVRADPRGRRRPGGDRASSIASAPASPACRPAPATCCARPSGSRSATGRPIPRRSCRPPTRPCTRPSAPASACASPAPGSAPIGHRPGHRGKGVRGGRGRCAERRFPGRESSPRSRVGSAAWI